MSIFDEVMEYLTYLDESKNGEGHYGYNDYYLEPGSRLIKSKSSGRAIYTVNEFYDAVVQNDEYYEKNKLLTAIIQLGNKKVKDNKVFEIVYEGINNGLIDELLTENNFLSALIKHNLALHDIKLPSEEPIITTASTNSIMDDELTLVDVSNQLFRLVSEVNKLKEKVEKYLNKIDNNTKANDNLGSGEIFNKQIDIINKVEEMSKPTTRDDSDIVHTPFKTENQPECNYDYPDNSENELASMQNHFNNRYKKFIDDIKKYKEKPVNDGTEPNTQTITESESTHTNCQTMESIKVELKNEIIKELKKGQ